MTFADRVLNFYSRLKLSLKLPDGVEVLNPYQNTNAFQLCEKFYHKFYHDNKPRTLILGINPGRFGGGVTGIPFTDPIKLENECAISNDLKKKPELSADFIYQIIHGFGGPEKFYTQHYIGAVSPLGFTKDGKNLNYYDIKTLQQILEPFIIQSIKEQLDFGINRDRCYCLGEGKNFEYLTKINNTHKFFHAVIPLAHPRFIMQYRRKSIQQYVDTYLKVLRF